jgi:hypothetical protein
MSASHRLDFCTLCELHVDNCECSTCKGDSFKAGCGVTIARWFEKDDGWCSKCRPSDEGEDSAQAGHPAQSPQRRRSEQWDLKS